LHDVAYRISVPSVAYKALRQIEADPDLHVSLQW
jgi:hypothetical protein